MYWMDLTSSVRCEFLYRSANSLACSSSTSWRVPRDSPRQLTHKRRSASETHMECASWVFQPLLNPATNSLMAESSLLLADSFAEATRAKPIPRAIAKTRIRIASTRLGSSVAAIEALFFMMCAPRFILNSIANEQRVSSRKIVHACPAGTVRRICPIGYTNLVLGDIHADANQSALATIEKFRNPSFQDCVKSS